MRDGTQEIEEKTDGRKHPTNWVSVGKKGGAAETPKELRRTGILNDDRTPTRRGQKRKEAGPMV